MDHHAVSGFEVVAEGVGLGPVPSCLPPERLERSGESGAGSCDGQDALYRSRVMTFPMIKR